MHKLVKLFFEKRVISTDIEMNKPLHNAILYLEESNEIVEKLFKNNTKKIDEHPAWSSMYDMYYRSYDHACGALSLFIIGQFRSSEALCRTAIESSVNLHYISLDDSTEKLIAYFKDYIETEKKQNVQWKNSVKASSYPFEAKKFHESKISDKDKAIEHYEKILKESFSLSNVDYDSNNTKWPNIFERFCDIKDEVSYRTIYLALCSQAHSDPEDIINDLMTRVIGNVDGLEESMFLQQYHFALYMIITIIQFHILASAMFVAKFEIDAKKITQLYTKTTKLLVEFSENMDDNITQNIAFNLKSNKT